MLNTTALTPYYGETAFKGGVMKWLGLAVGVIAAIAVPFLAPMVATAFGGGFFASIVGQGLIGAGMGAIGGAAGAAIGGQNIGKGALLGAAGGALAGGIGAAYNGAGAITDAAGVGGFPGTSANALPGTVPGASATPGVDAAGNAITPVTGEGVSALNAAGIDTAGGSLMDATLKAGASAAVSAIGLLGGSAQEDALKQMKAELENTQHMDDAVRQQKLDLYNTLLAQANNMDPARRQQLAINDVMAGTDAQARAMEREAASMGRSSDNASRQMQVAGASEAATAGSNAFYGAFGAQQSARRNASSVLPGPRNDVMAAYNQTLANAALADTVGAQKAAAGVIQPFVDHYASNKLGDRMDALEKKDKERAGLNTTTIYKNS